MLLVGITGPVGSEKSTILAQFAKDAIELGYAVDGFVSVAGQRPFVDKGASTYTLHWVKSGEETLFASRGAESGYVIEESTTERLQSWSTSLGSNDLVVLDEFGKWEAEGNGLIEIWPWIEKSRSRMVCVTLRAGVQADVERHLGRQFDLVLPVGEGTDARLISTLIELRDWERVGAYGAGSGGLEWSLGSWLHATKFPFVGTVMGSMQAAVLALVSEKLGRKSLTVWVSLISAGIKAMSPAGSKITPTIAITVQGFLFTLGAMVLRWSRVGVALGAFLVGVWSALQGVFIQYLILGKSLEKAWDAGIHFLADKALVGAPSFWMMSLVLAVINGCVSTTVTLLVTAKNSRYRDRLEVLMKSERPVPVGAGRSELFRPVFWLPLVIVTSILLFAKEQPMNIAWMILRAVAVTLVLGSILRLVRAEWMFEWLTRRGHWGPATAIRSARKHDETII